MDGTVLVFDDDCGFCTFWAEFFADRTDVPIVGFTDLDDEIRERLPPGYESCSHVVTAEGRYSCGASMEEMVCRTRWGVHLRPLVEAAREIGPYRWLREWMYRRIAHNRGLWGRVVSRPPPARTAENER